MNITPFDIYVISIADNIRDLLFFISVASGFGIIALSIFFAVMMTELKGMDEAKARMKPHIKHVSIVALIASVACCLCPSSKTLAAMYVIPPLANSELVSKDIPEAGKAIIELATEWMRSKTEAIKQEVAK